MPTRVSAAPCSGLHFIPGRNDLRVWSIPDLKNWGKDGNRSWMFLTKTEWTSVTKFIPGEDLHDGVTYERFLKEVNNHPRACLLYDPSHFVLQQLDYLTYIDYYHERIRMFHVKDAEFNPTGKQGVYGGYQPWIDRAGRFRSLGDGQVDFKSIFSKLTPMILQDGPFWNGNVASNIRKMARKKDPYLSKIISSG